MVNAVLHIGPMKTGTTSIAQYFFRASKAGVLPQGVYYPHGEFWFNNFRHVLELENLAFDEQGKCTGWANPETEPALERVAEETRKACGDSGQAVFIAETLLSREPTTAYIEGMRKHFDSVHCLINVRRQDAAASSIVAHRLRAGRAPIDRTLESNLRDEPGLLDKFDYLSLVTHWQKDNPGVRFSLLPVLEHDADQYRLVKAVYRACGWGDPMPVKDFEGKQFNPSPSPELIDELLKKRRSERRWSWVPQLNKKLEENVQLLKKQATRPKTMTAEQHARDAWRLTDDERRYVLHTFADSNQQLLAEYGNDPIFKDDWTEWNDHLQGIIELLDISTNR